ncbi:MAG TPA: Gfo/Idh/MocA family oxidoreductase [Tepidisphaeraceae bacterium]|jgi:predicted dehydrogenase|nr:Gfo/Idh/MocA family oxidoreductase [Tepidisphaeraceae bacterium]
MCRGLFFAFALLIGWPTLFSAEPPATQSPGAIIRVGIIGLDTSHCIAFTKLFNDPKAAGNLAGIHVVAAFPGGSPDIESSRTRVEGYTKQARELGVEIIDSIPNLLNKVDAVLLESVDGRPHLDQVRPVFEAGKPVFIDKPLAGSLVDAIAIAELGAKYNVPWFSCSSLRFGPTIQKIIADPKVGAVLGATAWSPAALEPSHPDLYWYGIHGVELLYTAMGTGCESVTRTHTDDTDIVVGIWKGGRVGTFRGTRTGAHDYGVVVFGAKSTAPAIKFEGYQPLAEQIAIFFKTRKAPVHVQETIELMAFMEAADESKRRNGAPVKLETVMASAQEAAAKKAAAAK